MDFYNNYAEEKLSECCFFCGGNLETKEHIPSKVFLDKPYPERLYTLDICYKCNNSFSLDEEYLASLIECAKCNTLNVEELERESIKKTLKHSPALLNKISNSLNKINDKLTINLNDNRLKNICLKLSKGHIFYDFSVSLQDVNYHAEFFVLPSLSSDERNLFEAVYELTKYPEVGSRASNRICLTPNNICFLNWNIIQDIRYRYYVNYDNCYRVKIVINEYLACEFEFEN